MKRKQIERAVGGDGSAISTELPAMDALDLLADLGRVFGPFAAIMNDKTTVADGLGEVAKELAGGELRRILPRLLAGTTVILPGDEGKLDKLDITSVEAFNAAFTGRKKYLVPVVTLALEVNFADFFGGVDLGALLQGLSQNAG